MAAGPLPLALLRPQLTALRNRIRTERADAHAAQMIELLDERDARLLEFLSPLVPGEELSAAATYLARDRQDRAVVPGTRHVLDAPHSRNSDSGAEIV
jgi:DNA sulfur modification protein DndD